MYAGRAARLAGLLIKGIDPLLLLVIGDRLVAGTRSFRKCIRIS